MTLLNAPALCVAAALLLQGAPARPVRFGHMADRLTAADLTQIAALAAEPERRLWVVVSFAPNFAPSSPWFLDVFLEPDRTTPSVRRGTLMTVKTATPAPEAYEGARMWSVQRMAEFGQVPTRGDPARVIDRRDLNRPFRIHGVFSDDEIEGLVKLVRTSPPDPSFKGTVGLPGSHVEGTWPVGLVLRGDDGSVEVSVLDNRSDGKNGQKIWLRREGRGWTVLRTGYWVAD
jgi:hypothetical protein